MTPDWSPLRTELALWDKAGLNLPLWWRDDDAVQPTAQLDHLTAMAERFQIPVHLAVIPSPASLKLANAIRKTDHLIPVVHGWTHQSHAPKGQKKAEFGAHRPVADMLAEATQSFDRMKTLFGTRLRPMFVPPWNRISGDLPAGLADIGYTSLSTFAPRRHSHAAKGLARINTHLDPINWRGNRSLVDPGTLIHQITRMLQDRRTGAADNGEPFGLLTHHLVHDADIWAFTQAILTEFQRGPVLIWTHPDQAETPT